MTENSIVCPKCNNPVTPGMKFCESCGAKIETVTTAVHPPETPDSPAPETSGSTGTPPAAGSPSERVKPEAPVPKKAAPAPIPETKIKKQQKSKEVWKDDGGKKPLPRQTMIIAGVVVLAILAAVVYFVVLPALSGPSSPSAGTGSLTPSPGVSGTTASSASQAVTPTLTAGPTDVVPSRFAVVLDAERDPISHNVTVTFKGGEGQNGVSTILVRLTRSDGQVLTQNFKPVTIGSGVTFTGTEKTDRVEATATFYSGEQYKILDKVFEYQKRNG